jgi:hypothetical protein
LLTARKKILQRAKFILLRVIPQGEPQNKGEIVIFKRFYRFEEKS